MADTTVETKVKLKKPITFVEFPDFVLSTPETESSKIAKLRRILGLPENSPLLDRELITRERETQVREYLRIREEEILKFEKGFIDRGKEKMEKTRKDAAGVKKGGINRLYTVLTMQRGGVSNAEEMVSNLEGCIPHVDYSLLRQKELIGFLNQLGAEGLRRALDRVQTFGYYIFTSDLQSPRVLEAFTTITSISDEDFQRVCDQLNPYFFLNVGGVCEKPGDSSPRPNFQVLVDIIKNKGLTEQQQRRLERAKELALLTNNVLLQTNSEIRNEAYYNPEVNLATVLNQSPEERIAEDFLLCTKDLVYQALKEQKEPKKVMANNANTIFRSLIHLQKDGLLPAAVDLASCGWDSSYLYGYYPDEKRWQEAEARIGQAQELIHEESRLPWVALFEELRGKTDFDITRMNEYEETYKQRERLTHLAVFLHGLPRELSLSFEEAVRFPGGKLEIDDHSTGSRIYSLATDGLLVEDQRLLSVIKHFGLINKSGNVSYPEYKINEEDLSLLAYLGENKNQIADLFQDYPCSPKAAFIEDILTDQVEVPPKNLEMFLGACLEPAAIDPDIAWTNIDKFPERKAIEIISNLPEDFIARLSTDDQLFVNFVRKVPGEMRGLFISNRKRFSEFTSGGKPTPAFFEFAVQKGKIKEADELLVDALPTFPPGERTFWSFFREQPYDIQEFLLGKPRDHYLIEDKINHQLVFRDFIKEARARPEICRRYESLTDLFNNLSLDKDADRISGDELGTIYLRIAEAHRLGRLAPGERTEVEAVENLRVAFSSLYHPEMTPYERMAWKVLQRQLPITANERYRTNMRNKADQVIEPMDPQRLSWVHQATHNYMSPSMVNYLRTFRQYLESGEREKFDFYRSMSVGPAQVPDYTEDDRQALLAIKELLPELDELIEFTSLFYEVRKETLEQAIVRTSSVLGRTKKLRRSRF